MPETLTDPGTQRRTRARPQSSLALFGLVVAAALSLALLLACGKVQAAERGYVLGAGDVVKVTIYEHPDLTAEARISAAGSVSLFLLGEVKIAGGSTAAAEAAIARRLQAGDFVKQPQVSVMVLQYHSQQVSLLGQVNKPGKYPLDGAATMVDLLALAGGVGPAGGDTAVLIKQRNQRVTRKEIDLTALLQSGEKAQNFAVGNDDVIFVPRAAQFYIGGEVQHPGAYRLEKNMTLAQALSLGGGLSPRGTSARLTVKRRGEGESVQLLQARLDERVQPDDVLEFPSQEISILGQVSRPGKYPFSTGATLVDAIALGGGAVSSGADTAVLIRHANETIRREIDLPRLLQGGDPAQNGTVADGDVIFVPRAPQFYIYGEVQHSGMYKLEKNMTVMQALSVGGGLTQRGTERGLKVRRRGSGTDVRSIDVKLTDLIQPDDVVYVQESLF